VDGCICVVCFVRSRYEKRERERERERLGEYVGPAEEFVVGGVVVVVVAVNARS
jgi:hypothetical protein